MSITARYKKLTIAAICAGAAAAWVFQTANPHSPKKPTDYANGLGGTAPLDRQDLIGNAPPPGEELYTGMTSPGAVLPHGITNLGPMNKDLDLSYLFTKPDSLLRLAPLRFCWTNGAVSATVGLDETSPPAYRRPAVR